MLVSELRVLLKKYKDEDLRLLIVEMYKAMPKRVREDKDIDTLLLNLHESLSIEKNSMKKNIKIDIASLKQEIDQFIEYAYNQYYFAPNSVVHKKERPKWRFKVKSYLKSLQDIPCKGEEGEIATNLLVDLYKMLCYGCGYYIFNTDNPFRSVGIKQTDLLDIVTKRKFINGISAELIKFAVQLVIDSTVDRETIHSSLIYVFIDNLKTQDAKSIAIDQCMYLKNELHSSKPKSSKKSWSSDYSEYMQKEKISNLVEMVVRLNLEISEYETAIKYYNQNNIEYNNEVALYILLEMLYHYELKEYWIREYENALKKKVKIRERLERVYNYIKKNNKFPEYYY